MEACSLMSGLEALALAGSTAWNCSMLSKQQAAPCQYPQLLSDLGLALAQTCGCGPAEGEGPHSPEDPSGAG